MMLRPQGWVVQYRLPWYERVLLGYGVFVGLFFAVVSFGGIGFITLRSLDGTLLPPAGRTAITIGAHVLVALFALWFGSVTLRWSIGSLMDLFGAEVTFCGVVEDLKVRRGIRGRLYSVGVTGQTVDLTHDIFATLAKGDPVWMRVGRFQRSLKELARPDRIATPPRAQAQAEKSTSALQAISPPMWFDVPPGTRARPHGPIPDDELRRSDVPSVVAPWTEVERFALTYDGAAGPEVAALLERHAKARTLPETLPELRAILFMEQRSHRHVSRAPSGEALARVRAIVEAIRERVPRAP